MIGQNEAKGVGRFVAFVSGRLNLCPRSVTSSLPDCHILSKDDLRQVTTFLNFTCQAVIITLAGITGLIVWIK